MGERYYIVLNSIYLSHQLSPIRYKMFRYVINKKYVYLFKTISYHKKVPTSKIHRLIHVSKQQTSKVVNKLIDDGYIIQTKKKNKTYLELSKKGKEINKYLLKIKAITGE